jgi:hypothetical protein
VNRTAAVLLCALLAAGCGYRLLRHADGRNVTVSVVTLGNDSVEPGVELTVTRALRQEFLRRAAPRLVSDPSNADWVIRGRVRPLDISATSFDTVALALEYRVEMTLELEVSDAEGRPMSIEETALKESELYLASADAEAASKNKDEALRRIADVLAGRIHDAIGLQLADRSRERSKESSAPDAPSQGRGQGQGRGEAPKMGDAS